jgi:hypothetical protein
VAAAQQRPARAAWSWLLGSTRDRLRAQAPLLAAVLAVAVLATTLITSLGLLSAATETNGVRGSLGGIPDEQTTVSVRLARVTGSPEEARAIVEAAVQKLVGASVSLETTGAALTEFGALGDGLAYLAQLDGIEQHAELVSGQWPGAAGEALPVAMPHTAATALGLEVGSQLSVTIDDVEASVEVVGTYETDEADEFWALDPLRGSGYNPAYPKPGLTFYSPITALGPLVVAPGGLARADLPVSSLQLVLHPDFSAVEMDDLGPLLDRLSTGDIDLRIDARHAAQQLVYESDAVSIVRSVASGLVVTRSTVVVTSLLLLVLAIAAMAQTARLFTDARAGERRLMRARGAGAGHLVALTAVEAVLLGILSTALSPLLATLAYRLVAAQPAMVAAGMPETVDATTTSIITAAAVSLAFVIVLIAPLLTRARGIAEEERADVRQSKVSGIMRSGLDLALIVLAAIAYWQLVSYRGVLDSSGSLEIDPVLAVGPALVLLAGGLLCVRLVPPAARLLEWLGSRSHRVVLPLASWELGRRPTRAIAAVLLISLAMAVGTFGLSFLSTWRQSQLDQAAVAIGAPVRVALDESVTTPPADDAAAVFRRGAVVQLGEREGGSDGLRVQLLGLAEGARDLLTEGRVGEVGGDRIHEALHSPIDVAVGIDLPSGATALDTEARLSSEVGVLANVAGELRVIVESAQGLLTTVSFGPMPIDGATHAVTAELPQGRWRIVGLQLAFAGDFGPNLDSSVITLDLGALTADATALAALPTEGWFAVNSDSRGAPPTRQNGVDGWPTRLTVEAPSGLASAFTLVGWKPQPAVIAVVPASLVDRYRQQSGALLSLSTQGATIRIQLARAEVIVPGAASVTELDAAAHGLSAGVTRASTIVLDQHSLARALAERGVPGAMVDEWWLVELPAGFAGTSYSAEVLGTQLQQAPLRVATQAALWLSIIAGAVLAAIGFALHSAATLRARRIELAQLRAIGLSRRSLVALVGAESALLCVLGIVFGIATGALLTSLVGPLVATSPDGAPPVPRVALVFPVAELGLLALGMIAVLAVVVLVVAQSQRRTQPADLLRGGAQP